MNKFQLIKNSRKTTSLTRTIRFKESTFDKLECLAESYDLSFNALVNQCVEYALENLDVNHPVILDDIIKEEL